mgnify:CR=1 FL=1
MTQCGCRGRWGQSFPVSFGVRSRQGGIAAFPRGNLFPRKGREESNHVNGNSGSGEKVVPLCHSERSEESPLHPSHCEIEMFRSAQHDLGDGGKLFHQLHCPRSLSNRWGITR